jgi:hypothetical protein
LDARLAGQWTPAEVGVRPVARVVRGEPGTGTNWA